MLHNLHTYIVYYIHTYYICVCVCVCCIAVFFSHCFTVFPFLNKIFNLHLMPSLPLLIFEALKNCEMLFGCRGIVSDFYLSGEINSGKYIKNSGDLLRYTCHDSNHDISDSSDIASYSNHLVFCRTKHSNQTTQLASCLITSSS